MWDARKPLLAGSVIVFFLFFVFLAGVAQQLSYRKGGLEDTTDFPDFSNYKFLRTLSTNEFRLEGPHDRIIAIGDIHGMNSSLSDLLTELAYDPRTDSLIHLGDIITRGGLKGSLAVLSFLSTNNIIGVRGNNDQKVIQWRAWRGWIQSLPGGRQWLASIDRAHPHGLKEAEQDDDDNEEDELSLAEFWAQAENKVWKKKVPKAWKLFERHYYIARSMSQKHYDYLRALPSVLHAPAGHTFFVHAGMFAADPTRRLRHPRQPLSHWPQPKSPETNYTVLRDLQEAALLTQIPQNKDSWVLMNMRTVKKDGTPSQKKKATPWPVLWNDIMDRCGGADVDVDESFVSSQRPFAGLAAKSPLPCFPSTVVYGHWASHGLETMRWSIGLDSGCVYGHRLSALVLDQKSLVSSDDSFIDEIDTSNTKSGRSSLIKYGDNGHARIVSVKC